MIIRVSAYGNTDADCNSLVQFSSLLKTGQPEETSNAADIFKVISAFSPAAANDGAELLFEY